MANDLDIHGDPAFAARGRTFEGTDQKAPLRDGLAAAGQYDDLQTAGRFYPMACVSLEITQRCNLDCSLCYLSDRAELAHDIPLPILFTRIAMIAQHYGPGTPVQISGGDPTLRSVEDLEAICTEIRRLGLRSCLMTNGIRATRTMLTRLARAGLNDVAFHVDLTEERKGYPTEASLNSVRRDYINRAKGLGLRILFNTTVFDGNIDELPLMARFFRDHAAHITLASFQMGADTGRGVSDHHASALSRDIVSDALSKGFETDLRATLAIGHRECNRYDILLVAGKKAISVTADAPFLRQLIPALESPDVERNAPVIGRMIRRTPKIALKGLIKGLGLLWKIRSGLIASRGRVHRMSVLIHSFMDAEQLDAERCASCVFMTMTSDGPMSMCAFNAKRDALIFKPVPVQKGQSTEWWSAATGNVTKLPDQTEPNPAPYKLLKGRQRALAARERMLQKP
ncbi:MAG: radical SAM protein [Litoreibacter sp.]|uniref:radical SAM protein n=1 Tax=Litoreibacter sp. TaxID=1969459 RepID=UPI0032981519